MSALRDPVEAPSSGDGGPRNDGPKEGGAGEGGAGDDTAAYDLFIIGGGVNGAGIARDAAGRGMKVALCDKGDFASATSSASTKLIHGGLRYLEYYEFALVRKALIERETLLRAAPHIIWPLRFVLPHDKGQRPVWMLRAGLFLYDHLGGRKILPPTTSLNLRKTPQGAPLKDAYTFGFEYSDCWVDDARLVILNLLDAKERGAAVMPRTAFVGAARVAGGWRVRLRDRRGGERIVRARAIVNAAGPWVSDVLANAGNTGGRSSSTLRLVKGSHVIVRKLYDGDHAYIFQNPDGRIQFAIPYERDYTLLGTTDIPYDGDKDRVVASAEECAYTLAMARDYFRAELSPDDIVHTYSGVRPLYDDAQSKSASAVTRDYVFELDGGGAEDGAAAPILSVFGGKITTYRVLAEAALKKLEPLLGASGRPWTRDAPLPGGDIPGADFDGFLDEARAAYPWLPERGLYRLARQYGTRLRAVLGDAASMADLGRDFSPSGGMAFTEAEAEYLVDAEWAMTADDILWRRTKLGLHLTGDEAAAVEAWLAAQVPDAERRPGKGHDGSDDGAAAQAAGEAAGQASG